MNSGNLKESSCVLAIDDADAVLEIERAALEAEGYKVYTTTNPREGVEIYRQHREKIQLVLLDYSMPGMNGGEVFHCMKQISPSVNVCLVTSREDAETYQLLAAGVHGYIRKPFRLEDIVHCAHRTCRKVS